MTLALDSIKSRFEKVGVFLYSHGPVIYTVLFLSALIGAVLGLNMALNQPRDEAYHAQKQGEVESPRFDTETIEKIKRLNANQQTVTDSLPAGQRTNPFGE